MVISAVIFASLKAECWHGGRYTMLKQLSWLRRRFFNSSFLGAQNWFWRRFLLSRVSALGFASFESSFWHNGPCTIKKNNIITIPALRCFFLAVGPKTDVEALFTHKSWLGFSPSILRVSSQHFEDSCTIQKKNVQHPNVCFQLATFGTKTVLGEFLCLFTRKLLFGFLRSA